MVRERRPRNLELGLDVAGGHLGPPTHEEEEDLEAGRMREGFEGLDVPVGDPEVMQGERLHILKYIEMWKLGQAPGSPSSRANCPGRRPGPGGPAKAWAIVIHSAATAPSATRSVSAGWRRRVTTRQKPRALPVTRFFAVSAPHAHCAPLGLTSSTRTSSVGAGRP